MTHTVIMLAWKRFRIIDEILQFWLSQPSVDEVILLDNSGKFTTQLPIILLNSNTNLGSGSRIPIVQYAKNETIIFCDDDLELKDGIVEDLERYWSPDTPTGIMGKIYNSDVFRHCKTFRGAEITEPVEVDYLPYNLALFHRKHLTGWDIKTCPEHFYLDDVFLCERLRRSGCRMVVVPTKNYAQSIENSDKYAMHKNPKLVKIRQEYHTRWIVNKEPLPY